MTTEVETTPEVSKSLYDSRYHFKAGKSYFTLQFQGQPVDLEIKKVPGNLLVEVQRSVPRPLPPKEVVKNDDGSVAGVFENDKSQAYASAMEDWQLKIESRFKKLVIKRGVVKKPLSEPAQEFVNELREFMLTDCGVTLDPDDFFVWVAYVLTENEEDYNALSQSVLSKGQPTEGAIAAAIESFSGNI